ncbi:uncharacterized protein LOC143018309 [Oratosquilla oratoria]|uniref:uncharacterized protein LOC143018309 n=1 Tax=Oratosquilla oratoria TaxID=337810 RepID=UPI003F7739EF
MNRFGNNTYNDGNIVTHFCGEMNVISSKCQAKHFAGETPADGLFNNCCHKGKIIPPLRREFPPYLMSLPSSPADPQYSHFKENIRNYNASVSFASMGAKIVQPNGRGPYTFRVYGQIYHRTSHMHSNDGQNRQFAQLYVIDSGQVTDIRTRNPANIVSLFFNRDINADRRRYNLPTVNDIAMIFQNPDGEPPFHRDFKVYPRNEDAPLISLNILSPNLDPMTYTPFFPFGEPGWQPMMEDNDRQGINLR